MQDPPQTCPVVTGNPGQSFQATAPFAWIHDVYMQVNITGDSLPLISSTDFPSHLTEYQNSTSQADHHRYMLGTSVSYELHFPTYKYDPLTAYQQMHEVY
jgi:hypothetical protein